jgi:Ca-activated chloride channel family protein
MDFEDVPKLMEESWPWMFSPIAYDLRVLLTPTAGFQVAESYGFPAAAPGENPGLETSTVFLSKKKGALLVQLVPVQGTSLHGLAVAGTLTYATPQGEGVTEDISAVYNDEQLDERGQYFPQPSVAKTVALALLTAAMNQAATEYATSHETAIATLEAALARYTADIANLDDSTLVTERDLAQSLLDLMENGAEQGDLYGYGQ